MLDIWMTCNELVFKTYFGESSKDILHIFIANYYTFVQEEYATICLSCTNFNSEFI